MSLDSLTIDELDELLISDLDALDIEGDTPPPAPDKPAVIVMSSNQKLALLEPMPWDLGAPYPSSFPGGRPPDPGTTEEFDTLDKIQLLWEYPLEPAPVVPDDEQAITRTHRRRVQDFYVRRSREGQAGEYRRRMAQDLSGRRRTDHNENNQ